MRREAGHLSPNLCVMVLVSRRRLPSAKKGRSTALFTAMMMLIPSCQTLISGSLLSLSDFDFDFDLFLHHLTPWRPLPLPLALVHLTLCLFFSSPPYVGANPQFSARYRHLLLPLSPCTMYNSGFASFVNTPTRLPCHFSNSFSTPHGAGSVQYRHAS